MEELISKWIKETLLEHEKAKKNQNLYKMNEMQRLESGLRALRDKLLKSNSSRN